MNYVKLHYEAQAERYLREDNGDEVEFTRQVIVLYKHEELVAKLSFSRQTDDRHGALPTKRPIPVLRIDGTKIMFDDEDIEVAEDCLVNKELAA